MTLAEQHGVPAHEQLADFECIEARLVRLSNSYAI